MRKNPLTAITPRKFKDVRIAQVGTEALYDPLLTQQVYVSFETMSREISDILNKINIISVLSASLEQYGYDRGVVDMCNSDGHLHRILHIHPDDIMGKSPNGIKDVYQTNIWSSIKAWLKWAWQKLLGFFKAILDFFNRGLDFMGAKSQEVNVENFEINISKINPDSAKLPPNLSIESADMLKRIKSIGRAIKHYNSLPFNTTESKTYTYLKKHLLNTIRDIVCLDGIILDDQGVAVAQSFNTRPGKTYRGLGWVKGSSKNIARAYAEVHRETVNVRRQTSRLREKAIADQREFSDATNIEELKDIVAGYTLTLNIATSFYKILETTNVIFADIGNCAKLELEKQ